MILFLKKKPHTPQTVLLQGLSIKLDVQLKEGIIMVVKMH